MTGFNTQVGDGLYRIQIETNNQDAYKIIQSVARAYVDAEQNKNTVNKSGWISVEDRLPDYWIPVLVCMRHRHTPNDGYRDMRIIVRSKEYGWARLEKHYEITHWMNLPEPPKEE